MNCAGLSIIFFFVPVKSLNLVPTKFAMDKNCKNEGRRDFLKKSTALATLAVTSPMLLKAGENDEKIAALFEKIPLHLEVNGKAYSLSVEPRVTLLDLIREQLHLTGTKKGCDYGQCGACTVHVDGKRINSCLSLAVMNEGKKITTIEGLLMVTNYIPCRMHLSNKTVFNVGIVLPDKLCRLLPASMKDMPTVVKRYRNL